MGDETKEIRTGPYKGYTLNTNENTLSGHGEYDGEVLASCSAKDGYLRVPGMKFTGQEMGKLREALNIGTSRLFLDTQALIPGTICVKVDDPAQNKFALEQLDDHCPLKDENKCEAVADTIEKSKPDSDVGKELLITCLLGFGILTPLGGKLVESLFDFFKGKGGPKDPPGGDAKKPGGGVSPKSEPESPVAKREGGPDLGNVVIGGLIGGVGLYVVKSLFGAGATGAAGSVPGLVPQGAFGSGPSIVPSFFFGNKFHCEIMSGDHCDGA